VERTRSINGAVEDLALQIAQLGVKQLHGLSGLREAVSPGEAKQAQLPL